MTTDTGLEDRSFSEEHPAPRALFYGIPLSLLLWAGIVIALWWWLGGGQ